MEGKWSEFLFPASLTTSGRPVLQPGEVECSTLDSVDLELVQSPDPNTNFPTLRSGLLILTTFRFLFIDQNSRVSFSIPLSVVSHVSGPKKSIKSMFHSPRIRVRVSVSNDGRVAEKGQRFAEIVCVLRGKSDPDSFVGRLWEVLRSRPWESLVGSEDKRESEVGRVAESSSVWRPAMAGVSGILRKEQEQWESTDKSLQDAFQDLNALMLADFVKIPLERAGGMMALIDVYCLFNRARGTELIAPEDLLQACAIWEKFDVPVLLRKFDSGVMVVQSKAHSDEEVFARIRSLALKPEALRTGISPSDAARTLGVAPALAKEHLLAAENKGLLCRDIAPEGLRFYLNLFIEVNPSNMYMDQHGGLLGTWVSIISSQG
ncbi:hypothetical protein AMTRI_Chr01g126720 [Amborella trichopoda]